MRIDLDDRGRLRLDQAGFEALVSSDLDDARATGGSGLAPPARAAAPALSAVRDPLVRLRCRVGGRLVLEHHGWVTPEVAALLLDSGSGEYELVSLEPQFLAAALAKVVQLGPREAAAPAATTVDADTVEDFFHHDHLRRTSALAQVEARLAWSVEVAWETSGRALTVVDTLRGAQLVVSATEPASQRAPSLTPTTATTLWRRLTTLLPADEELEVSRRRR